MLVNFGFWSRLLLNETAELKEAKKRHIIHLLASIASWMHVCNARERASEEMFAIHDRCPWLNSCSRPPKKLYCENQWSTTKSALISSYLFFSKATNAAAVLIRLRWFYDTDCLCATERARRTGEKNRWKKGMARNCFFNFIQPMSLTVSNRFATVRSKHLINMRIFGFSLSPCSHLKVVNKTSYRTTSGEKTIGFELSLECRERREWV